MIVQAKTKIEALEAIISAMLDIERQFTWLMQKTPSTTERDSMIILRNQMISLRDALTFEGLPVIASKVQLRINVVADLLCGHQTWSN